MQLPGRHAADCRADARQAARRDVGATLLTSQEPITVPVDLVVLVTGMVPRENAELSDLLKLPVGDDGFYNEIHPKLRPVETVVDGVLIAGACQGPKTAAEASPSGLAAVTQSAAHPARRASPSSTRWWPLSTSRRVHRLRRVPHGLPVRRDQQLRLRHRDGRHDQSRPTARAAAAACRTAPRTRSTSSATPTPRCGRRSAVSER